MKDQQALFTAFEDNFSERGGNVRKTLKQKITEIIQFYKNVQFFLCSCTDVLPRQTYKSIKDRQLPTSFLEQLDKLNMNNV